MHPDFLNVLTTGVGTDSDSLKWMQITVGCFLNDVRGRHRAGSDGCADNRPLTMAGIIRY